MCFFFLPRDAVLTPWWYSSGCAEEGARGGHQERCSQAGPGEAGRVRLLSSCGGLRVRLGRSMYAYVLHARFKDEMHTVLFCLAQSEREHISTFVPFADEIRKLSRDQSTSLTRIDSVERTRAFHSSNPLLWALCSLHIRPCVC
jgi:hypothetical protein